MSFKKNGANGAIHAIRIARDFMDAARKEFASNADWRTFIDEQIRTQPIFPAMPASYGCQFPGYRLRGIYGILHGPLIYPTPAQMLELASTVSVEERSSRRTLVEPEFKSCLRALRVVAH